MKWSIEFCPSWFKVFPAKIPSGPLPGRILWQLPNLIALIEKQRKHTQKKKDKNTFFLIAIFIVVLTSGFHFIKKSLIKYRFASWVWYIRAVARGEAERGGGDPGPPIIME